MTVSWAWRTSKQIMPSLAMRARFLTAAIREPSVSAQLAKAKPDSNLGALIAEWPQTAAILLAPYQCASWDAETRLHRLEAHLQAIANIPGLKLGTNEKLILADLSKFSPGSFIALDRAQWLAREGHLTLSLFKGEFRAFTVSFSLSGFPAPELFVGGLQGRQSEEILALYRDLTKDFAGMRPRDLVLEMLRLFARRIDVSGIFAVADACKISRHRYFGEKGAPGLNYDDVWRERNGTPVAQTHFQLPLEGMRRSMDDIAAKKRSMYRRRYQMLDEIQASMPLDLSTAERRHFDAV